VRDNLLVARGDLADDDLVAVLERVGLGRWLAALPDGLATVLDPGPVSGGERRRLLVARALLVGSRVLLLDEPTEHLDPAGAAALADALQQSARQSGAAVVLATHEPWLALRADRVIDVSAVSEVAR
jgi:ATP-binding cassette subfamily C protein CydC